MDGKTKLLSLGVNLCHLDVEKNSNLDKSNLSESFFTKMTFHIRDFMAFRSNELGLALLWHSLLKQGHIRHTHDPWDGEERQRGRFSFRPFSIFGVPKSSFFMNQNRIKSWAQHPI
jgi:hypothetical protein